VTTDPIADRIAALIQPLLEEREQLMALRQELINRRAGIDAELVKVDRVLRAAGHDPAATTKKRPPPPGPIASPQRQATVYDTLARNGGKMSCDEIAEETRFSSSSVHNALQILRSNGTVRLAGYRGNAKLYAVSNESPPSAGDQEPKNGDIRAAVLARFQEIGADGANLDTAAEGMPYHRSTVANYVHKLVESGELTQIRTQVSKRGREMAIYAVAEEVTSNG
jgi:predicted transcriptional regulator